MFSAETDVIEGVAAFEVRKGGDFKFCFSNTVDSAKRRVQAAVRIGDLPFNSTSHVPEDDILPMIDSVGASGVD